MVDLQPGQLLDDADHARRSALQQRAGERLGPRFRSPPSERAALRGVHHRRRRQAHQDGALAVRGHRGQQPGDRAGSPPGRAPRCRRRGTSPRRPGAPARSPQGRRWPARRPGRCCGRRRSRGRGCTGPARPAPTASATTARTSRRRAGLRSGSGGRGRFVLPVRAGTRPGEGRNRTGLANRRVRQVGQRQRGVQRQGRQRRQRRHGSRRTNAGRNRRQTRRDTAGRAPAGTGVTPARRQEPTAAGAGAAHRRSGTGGMPSRTSAGRGEAVGSRDRPAPGQQACSRPGADRPGSAPASDRRAARRRPVSTPWRASNCSTVTGGARSVGGPAGAAGRAAVVPAAQPRIPTVRDTFSFVGRAPICGASAVPRAARPTSAVHSA